MPINSLDELKTDFLTFAVEVNTNRAFPDARDGLKPSQRACLWEMYDKGYSSDKPHVKCAKVDGGVIANWHPHGSEYSTFVRMSQPWLNNICEVDFHGSNGSMLGGDKAAASRYTECRLSKASEAGLLEGIKKNTVKFIDNFSEDLKWPEVLPAIMPRLFVNGSQGIGYTIAQEWEPGNIKEFLQQVKLFIDTGTVDCNNIYPDYPTGGVIINKKDLHTIYETGKGSVVVRAKTSVEDNIIKITELPYQVYAEQVIQKIKDLVNSGTLTGIEDIFNKSGDDGLLIEIECSSDPSLVLNRLFKLTELQCTFNANQMALVNKEPVMLNLLDYIKVYYNHNCECITNEYRYDLEKATARKEIVEGLIKAIKDLDNIIATIRKSSTVDSARKELIKVYGFTANQAQAITDMRLSKLAHTESKSLENEDKTLAATIKNCKLVIGSKSEVNKIFISRLEKFVAEFAHDRRTEVIDLDIVKEKTVTKAVVKNNNQCMILLTKDNHIKRIPIEKYKPNSKPKTDNDMAISELKVGVKDKLVLISNAGIMYKLQANKLESGIVSSIGTDLRSLYSDKIISIYSGTEPVEYISMITKNGLIKKIEANNVFSISKTIGTQIMKLDEDEIVGISTDREFSVKLTDGTNCVVNTDKFKPKGRSAGGVKCIKLKNNQKVSEVI